LTRVAQVPKLGGDFVKKRTSEGKENMSSSADSSARLRAGKHSGCMPRPAWGVFFALVLLAFAMPAAAQTPPEESPTLSVSDRLDDRRYVTTGTRGYVVGTEAGRFPAMGFHTRGEMGGIWSPPIKLLDGIWFGIEVPTAGRRSSSRHRRAASTHWSSRQRSNRRADVCRRSCQ
jgi:hypothetical protein